MTILTSPLSTLSDDTLISAHLINSCRCFRPADSQRSVPCIVQLSCFTGDDSEVSTCDSHLDAVTSTRLALQVAARSTHPGLCAQLDHRARSADESVRLQEAGIPRIVAAGVPTFPCIRRRDGVLASADAHLVHGLLCDSLAHGMYNDKSKNIQSLGQRRISRGNKDNEHMVVHYGRWSQ